MCLTRRGLRSETKAQGGFRCLQSPQRDSHAAEEPTTCRWTAGWGVAPRAGEEAEPWRCPAGVGVPRERGEGLRPGWAGEARDASALPDPAPGSLESSSHRRAFPPLGASPPLDQSASGGWGGRGRGADGRGDWWSGRPPGACREWQWPPALQPASRRDPEPGVRVGNPSSPSS